LNYSLLADRITLVNEEANSYLQRLCRESWDGKRAVVFLDPFGMQVKWTTIETLARTKAVDTWILFPLGVAVNRLLTRSGEINEAIRARLDDLFGTTDWFEVFYETSRQVNLFGDRPERVKTADFRLIGEYFVKRLKTVFAGVADNPRPLRNSRNIPLYLLCFAAANPRGASIALRIAQYILKDKPNGAPVNN
jgi:three-Cys-motif partner protein